MNTNTENDQIAIACVLMRGGTSKGVFFHEKDIPPAGPARDALLKRMMGTPDLIQIDGLGGSRLVTSKIAIIKPSTRADADVDYTFAQADIERDRIDYDSNCGNISSAVGPFAIDEGLVEVQEPLTTVRIYNTNTQKLLIAKVPVANGKARVLGDCAIAGVPGTGAEILIDYSGSVGAKTGKLLPTGNLTDTILLESGRRIEVTLCDVANPSVFVTAADLGFTGSELPEALTQNQELLETVGELQAKAGEMMGMWQDWRSVHLPQIPLFVMVAPPADYVDANGETHKAASMDLRARLLFFGKWHESMAGTGSMCTAAASRVPGSLVNRAIGSAVTTKTLRIGHPLGVMTVKVVADASHADTKALRFSELGLTRTARRLMGGSVYVPGNYQDTPVAATPSNVSAT